VASTLPSLVQHYLAVEIQEPPVGPAAEGVYAS
jgi:hypothetical protein